MPVQLNVKVAASAPIATRCLVSTRSRDGLLCARPYAAQLCVAAAYVSLWSSTPSRLEERKPESPPPAFALSRAVVRRTMEAMISAERGQKYYTKKTAYVVVMPEPARSVGKAV